MKWILREDRSSTNFSLLDRVIYNRGLFNLKIGNYSITDLDSFQNLFNIDIFVKLIEEFKKKNVKIFIHGDFDVDGISATALLWRFLYEELNLNVIPFIPDRFTDGYGLTKSSIENIIDQGGEVIITVDCGVKDGEIIHEFSDRIKFIVTDHHTLLLEENINTDNKDYFVKVGEYYVPSKALCVIHPKLSSVMGNVEISGSMVALKLCLALVEYFKMNIDLGKYVALAALGTVCDVMPLVEDNRIVTTLGLKEIANRKCVGLNALIDTNGLSNTTLTTYDIGFIIGPRLNAAGRLESAMTSLRLLCTNSYDYALKLAQKLNLLNSKRQQETDRLLKTVENLISVSSGNFLYAYDYNWPEGIIGLVAGKLAEKYYKPIAVGSILQDSIKASARSIDGFNITKKIGSLSKYLQRYGGHEKAAGFTLPYSNAQTFFSELTSIANEEITNDMLEKKLYIDLEIKPNEINIENYMQLSQLEPFGYGNTRPMFLIKSVKLMDVKHFSKVSKFTFIRDNIIFSGFSFEKFDVLMDMHGEYDLVFYMDFDGYAKNISIQIVDTRISI